MNIWLTQTGENLPLHDEVRKMRSGYLAERLSNRGHDVVWWASAFDHMQKHPLFAEDKEVVLNGRLRIRALTSRGYRKNISLGRYFDHLLLARKMARQFHAGAVPDLIIASMPDHWSAYQAVRYAVSKKIPVIVDVRDEWPDVFLKVFPPVMRPMLKHLLIADYKKVEYLMKNATAILSMMEYMLNWALIKAGREKTWRDRVFYLGSRYAARPPGAPVPEKFSAMANKLNGQCVVTFVGTMGSYYNPLILAEVAAEMRHNKNLFFIIAGNGVHFDALQRYVQNFDNVFLPGWVSDPEIQYLLSISHIGVIPCSEEINTFPNKAYAYLSAGLPIVSSVQGELGKLVEENRIGFTYPVGDHNTLAAIIDKLAGRMDLRKEMSQNAAKIFKEKYDAEVIYDEFVAHVERVAEMTDF